MIRVGRHSYGWRRWVEEERESWTPWGLRVFGLLPLGVQSLHLPCVYWFLHARTFEVCLTAQGQSPFYLSINCLCLFLLHGLFVCLANVSDVLFRGCVFGLIVVWLVYFQIVVNPILCGTVYGVLLNKPPAPFQLLIVNQRGPWCYLCWIAQLLDSVVLELVACLRVSVLNTRVNACLVGYFCLKYFLN